MLALNVHGILGHGAGVEVSCSQFTQLELLGMAKVANSKGAHLTIRDALKLSDLDRLGIATNGGKAVTLVY